jgi:hypothetical protein
MKKMKMIFCFVLFICIDVMAQEQVTVPIEIISRTADGVGQRLVYKVKEGLRSSNFFRITQSKEPRMQMIIQTISRGDKVNSTIFSVIWNICFIDKRDHETVNYLNSYLGYAGAQVLDGAAEEIIANTDEQMEIVLKVLTELVEQSQ